jgi:hypothetical protein
LEEFERTFVQQTLAFHPTSATAAGYHEHEGMLLDEHLGDYTESRLDRQLSFYTEADHTIQSFLNAGLDAESHADLELIRRQVRYGLFELNTLQSHRMNPTIYVETIGNGIYTPFVLEYAPKGMRERHIISRLQKVEGFRNQARLQFLSSPAI